MLWAKPLDWLNWLQDNSPKKHFSSGFQRLVNLRARKRWSFKITKKIGGKLEHKPMARWWNVLTWWCDGCCLVWSRSLLATTGWWHVISVISLSVTGPADPQLLVPLCTPSSAALTAVHSDFLYSPGCGLFLTQNIKTDTTNINHPHRLFRTLRHTSPDWSHQEKLEELIITCLWSLRNSKGIVCWRVNSPGLDFSMFWVKLSLKWLLANLSAKFLLWKFSIFLGFQSNLILTLCKLRTEGAKPSILEQKFKKFKQVSVSKPNPSLWKIKCSLLGPKLG